MTKNRILAPLICLLWLPFPAKASNRPKSIPPLSSAATHPEIGRPFLTYYSPQQYGAAAQVWSFAQDSRGILYVGNGGGLLEYDGVKWRLIRTPGNVIVRDVARGDDGRIYVGAVGNFGFLAPDENGQLKFASLLEYVKQEDREFQDIYTINPTRDGIYFLSRERLFRFTRTAARGNAGKDAGSSGSAWNVRVWKPQTRFRSAFEIYGTYYVREVGEGLLRMVGDTLEEVPGSEAFANDGVRVMLPYSGSGEQQNKVLVATGTQGLFLMDDSGFVPFRTEADSLLRRLVPSRGAVLRDGSFGFGTAGGGFVILDRNGRMRGYLDRTSGLPVDGVLNVFVDAAGAVWLGLQSGICKVETPSPLSRFDTSSGLSGAVNDIVRHSGILYLATIQGVYFLDAQSGSFRLISGLPGGTANAAWGLLPVGDTLLAALTTGIYRIDGKVASAIRQDLSGAYSPFVLRRSRQDGNRVFVGLIDGLASMRRDATGRWLDEGRIAALPVIRNIVEQEPGTLWLGTESSGIIRVRLTAGSLHNPIVDRFGRAQGLPGDGGASVHSVAGRLVFTTKEGVRGFDEKSGRFVPFPMFDVVSFGGSPEEHCIEEDRNGDIWINFGVETALLRRQADGTYRPDKSPVQRFADSAAMNIYPEQDGIVWFGLSEGLVRYDPSIQKNYTADYPALIRRVMVGEKTLLYGGAGSDPAEGGIRQLAYRNNALRFEFAATNYDSPYGNEYQSMLEGFDETWSDWTGENKRDYTNLPPGDFRFRVRARNIYMHESSEADYSFVILPPWYRTWWAFSIYALVLVAGIVAIDRTQRRRLILKERENALLREAKLRAETAEAQARALQAENERNKNIELLSEIGKQITASLDFDTIFHNLYQHVNQLVDASVFGVGIYHPGKKQIECRLAYGEGKHCAPYTRDITEKDQLPVWCIENRQPVFINDVTVEFSHYIERYDGLNSRLEDGSFSAEPLSLIYLPLIAQDRVLGIITVQSLNRNAYTEYHLNILENLAAYTTIALDNADAYRRLNATLDDLQATLERLRSTQEQLVVQEKLASLGALTAGIAHEIKNPLNFVNNFAELSLEILQELREEIAKQKPALGERECGNIESLVGDLETNAQKISEHGKRADSIVRSMLLHSRGQKGERQSTDINAVLEEYLNLSYHGMRAKDTSFNVTLERAYDSSLGNVQVVPQDLSRVFLNILNNACYAVSEKQRQSGNGIRYQPTVSVRTRNLGDRIEVRIRDNGTGIPPEVRERIFHPFFTTKPTGHGTGLGLSISHDIIVQEHGGELEVETEPGQFTEFIIRLPRERRQAA
jgi:signal transduction histidine kinase